MRLFFRAMKHLAQPVGIRSPWQRVRFAVLELEALVAGIDYDVEPKTYLRNFLAMARSEGLEVLEHQRVHATVGDSAHDAGTHVMALCRARTVPDPITP
ncbi:hypothetical protein ACFVMC_13580 [Nocardia sp. NPDC127579]|uniref:hypothetical protein n=1 Tax=Nocardia sp. NPDC127579 TaxID=3345402 RepID=UPI00362B80EE